MNRRLVETWLVAEAALFAAAAVIHSVPLFGQPRIIAAVIVEGVCAVMLLAAAVGVHRDVPFARRAAIAANGVAIGTVGLGLLALWVGLAASTPVNVGIHRGLLGLMVTIFLLLASPLGAIAFRRPKPQRAIQWNRNDDWFVHSQPTSP